MNRIIVLICVITMAAIFAACGGVEDFPETTAATTVPETTAATTAPETTAATTAPETTAATTAPETTAATTVPETTAATTAPETTAVTTAPETTAVTTAPETTPVTEAGDGLRPEFKAAMDSYEAFYDSYCEILTKYKANPSDLSILTEYSSMLVKMAEMQKAFDEWNSEDLNKEELAYYLEVSNRITQNC